MIDYSEFTECYENYLAEYQKARNIFQARKDDLIRAINSLLAHPDTSKEDCRRLLKEESNL